mmetsp:Transcript_35789/g.93886  ORF Transcript_35789/g.93886 Transcript_35789/m.93886 type:complete len:136 (+) Transcript_35789:91-498(+)
MWSRYLIRGGVFLALFLLNFSKSTSTCPNECPGTEQTTEFTKCRYCKEMSLIDWPFLSTKHPELNKADFILSHHAINVLRNITGKIVIVSIVGKMRGGKSTLLGRLSNILSTCHPKDHVTFAPFQVCDLQWMAFD